MATAITASYYDGVYFPPVRNNTYFGYYDNDVDFVSSAPKFCRSSAGKLGFPLIDLELTVPQMYGAFEEAVSIYGKEVYEYQIRQNYLSLEGTPTGSLPNFNTTLIQPNLGNIMRIAKDYGSEVGTGGNVNYYTGSLPLTVGQQMYDLNQWALETASIQPGDSIEVKRVYYEIPPAVTRYFDPTIGTGFGYQNMLDSFGFGNMSPAINFMLLPVYADALRIQAIEFNDQVRRSAYSFELVDNQLRVLPVPAFERTLFFSYVKNSEKNAPFRPVGGAVQQDLITNVGNVPYSIPVYTQINAPMRRWIFDYGVSVCKEILGNIRSKYSVNEIPGNSSSETLNGPALLDQSSKEKDALLASLRETLNAASRKSQLEQRAQEAQFMNQLLQDVPMCIYIG